MTELPARDVFTDAMPKRRRIPRALIVFVAALVVGLAGWAWIHTASRTASTDNAYVRADSTIVAPKVRGLVAEILVSDNARVTAGTPLLRLDDEEYVARLTAARADAALADASVAAAQAAVIRLGAEQQLAAANETTAATAIAAADADAARADAERTRQRALLATGFVTRRGVESADADAARARGEAERARAALGGRAREADVTLSRRAELLAALAQARAGQGRAQASVALAEQDLAHTVIRAPIPGTVGDRQVNPGEYVQPGTRLLRLVSGSGLYVIANFKETQTARMLPGMPVTIDIDALPGTSFTGRVQSFAPGSGSDFAMLPFEPGTGNFTKIVQRVPVRIAIDPGQPGLDRLRSGLSAEVNVDLSAQVN
jgi:membrane fusion protein (multidrug efflux system)